MIEIPSGTRVFGIQLPIQSQSASFVGTWEAQSGPTELARIAKTADDAGYHYIGVCDHVTLPESVVGGMGTLWMEPISTLSWLAAHTTKVGLLTHVYVLAYRHPLMAAKQFAQLDYLSRGRALIGIGAGHVEAEFDKLGVDFHRRGKLTDEGIPVLAAALESEFVDGFGALPAPVQSPRPPIWVAGSSGPAIARAAKFGDGWLPQGPSNQAMVDSLQAQREAAGRAEMPMMIGHITPFIYVGDPDFEVAPGTISGSPVAIAEQILAGTATGVNQIQVRFRARSCDEQCEQMVAFATDVAPLLTTIS
ncbi:MAG: hypothetical protein JWM34_273 [Ilumatobacteraceae bacterium]|nr:hypothetical protein [Ilumatobacteraceae bacterium]